MGRILLLEDEESLRRGISFKLEKEGYQVTACSGIQEATRYLHQSEFDLIICDIMLEDGNGLEFCKEVRKTSQVHFMFLTALDTELDVVMGYEAGADDYLVKPFSLSVLISKVNAIFRRLKESEEKTRNCFKSGTICFWQQEMKVYVCGEERLLSKTELRLLAMFLEHPKQVLSKNQLLEALWDSYGDFVDENTVAVNIRRLREKIEENPSKPYYIKNVRGLGYLWDMPVQG